MRKTYILRETTLKRISKDVNKVISSSFQPPVFPTPFNWENQENSDPPPLLHKVEEVISTMIEAYSDNHSTKLNLN